MITALRRSGPRAASSALAAALVLGACGGAPEPAAVESCLREEGVSVARQPGTSPPVEAKINFASAGTPDPETSGKVVFYASEDEAARNRQASERLGETTLRQKGKVLYSPFHAGGTPEESEALVEGCVVNGEAGAAAKDDDSDKKKKKKKKR